MWDDLDLQTEGAPPSPAVLVAIVPTLADWDRVQREGWYRIPADRAPQQIGADYVAFYHPACFGALRWSIRSYAAILRYSLVTRRELVPEEPGHPRAGALYYRLELGPLQALPHPIYSARLRRVTFIRTDFERLFAARELCELWPHERGKDRLWRGLQIRSPEGEYLACAA